MNKNYANMMKRELPEEDCCDSVLPAEPTPTLQKKVAELNGYLIELAIIHDNISCALFGEQETAACNETYNPSDIAGLISLACRRANELASSASEIARQL